MKRDIQRIMLATAVPLFLIFILFLLKIVEVGKKKEGKSVNQSAGTDVPSRFADNVPNFYPISAKDR